MVLIRQKVLVHLSMVWKIRKLFFSTTVCSPALISSPQTCTRNNMNIQNDQSLGPKCSFCFVPAVCLLWIFGLSLKRAHVPSCTNENINKHHEMRRVGCGSLSSEQTHTDTQLSQQRNQIMFQLQNPNLSSVQSHCTRETHQKNKTLYSDLQ